MSPRVRPTPRVRVNPKEALQSYLEFNAIVEIDKKLLSSFGRKAKSMLRDTSHFLMVPHDNECGRAREFLRAALEEKEMPFRLTRAQFDKMAEEALELVDARNKAEEIVRGKTRGMEERSPHVISEDNKIRFRDSMQEALTQALKFMKSRTGMVKE